MLDYLKLPGSLFFILFIFIFTISAQTFSENESPETELKKSFPDRSHLTEDIKKDPSAGNVFGKESNNSQKTEKQNSVEETVEPKDWKLRRGNKTFSVEYGISPFNPSNFAGPKEFDVYGRDLHLFSFRFGRIVGTKKNVSYE